MNNIKNKKGFTLVELIAVVVIVIVLMVIAINLVNKQMERSRVNAFIKEANTFVKGAVSKESVDRTVDLAVDDIFHNSVKGKVCYSISQKILGKYVTKTQNEYHGSVEVCYGLDCEYQTKIWVTDGKHFVDGLTEISDQSQISSSFSSTQYPETCGVKAIGGGIMGDLVTAEYDYTGEEQVFDVLISGVYAIEIWGAQGGIYNSYNGGYGGYSYGEVQLIHGDKLYINNGGMGVSNCNEDTCPGGYNSAGQGSQSGTYNGTVFNASGGGATSIATKPGLLSTPLNVNNILLVAGGGGAARTNGIGSHGGGYCGGVCINGADYSKSTIIGRSDTAARGIGGGYTVARDHYSVVGAGGTGYLSGRLTNAIMYKYGGTATNTLQSPDVSDEPIPTYAKMGNGYTKITYIENFTDNN